MLYLKDAAILVKQQISPDGEDTNPSSQLKNY